MKFGKKGTEKPIEIFVALFIILAVAMLMLRVFTNQLTEQEQELNQLQRDNQQSQLRQTAIQHCSQACTTASRDCSTRSLAQLCLTYGTDAISRPDFLDLDLDGEEGIDRTLLVGTAVCEDQVPCHALITSCCGFQITASNCKKFLTDYWDTEGLSTDDQNLLMNGPNRIVKPGVCYEADMSDHWFNRAGFNVTTS